MKLQPNLHWSSQQLLNRLILVDLGAEESVVLTRCDVRTTQTLEKTINLKRKHDIHLKTRKIVSAVTECRMNRH